jgi:hypothetical protein
VLLHLTLHTATGCRSATTSHTAHCNRLPQCYYISPPALKTAFFQKFTDMTLFYIFYHFLTRPTDQPHAQLRESLVKFAYSELVSRGWQHQQPNNVWVTHSRDSNELKYFDMRAMEMRPFVAGQVGPIPRYPKP